MTNCNHDCEHCSSKCDQRTMSKEDFLIQTRPDTHIGKVIAVVSGKGGVGKSLVTSLLAVTMNRAGYKTAILDADITGPSIPQSFGLSDPLSAIDENTILPAVTTTGIKVVSTNLLLEDFSTPVIWRGPVLAGVVKQFYSDTEWGDLDYMFVDLPPGTGDVPLTIFQSLPLDGVIVVSTPQQMVGGIVEKAIRMAQMMEIPVLGIIENMSYIECDECGHQIPLFGQGNVEAIADKYDTRLLAKLPLNSSITVAVDGGNAEYIQSDELFQAAKEALENL